MRKYLLVLLSFFMASYLYAQKEEAIFRINPEVQFDGFWAPTASHAQQKNFFSQDTNVETIFGNDALRSGGYGSPEVKFTKIMNSMGVLVGGRGGWIINNTFSIGGGGYGLVTSHKTFTRNDTARYLRAGYGGLILEYINSSNKVVHFTLNVLVGGGSAANSYSDNAMINHSDFNDNHNQVESESNFYVFEPGVTVDFNLFTFMRVGVGASWRLVSGLDLEGVKSDQLGGPSGLLAIKFGRF